MAQQISDFITNFNGGFRPNRFIVTIDQLGTSALTYHCRAASLPTITTTVIQVPYRGRIYKLPGQRTFGTWNITVIDDKPDSTTGAVQSVWNNLMNWSNEMMQNVANTTTDASLETFMKPVVIKQLDFNGNVVKPVTLDRAWPSVVGEIRFSQDDPESLCSFDVSWEYQYVSSYAPTSSS